MLDLAVAAGPLRDDTVQAVHDDAAVTSLANAWLANRAAVVGKAVAGFGKAADLARTSIVRTGQDGRGPAIELLMHLLDQDAGGLAARLASEDRRFLTHQLARELARPEPEFAALAPRLQELLAAPGQGHCVVRFGNRGMFFTVDFTDELRTLVAMALVAAGVPFPPPAGLDAALRDTVGVGSDALARHVATLRQEGRLVALLDSIEDRCREALGITDGPRWPSVGTSRL